MRAIIVAIISMFAATGVWAQQTMHVHSSGSVDSHLLAEGDSIYFDAQQTTMYFLNNGTILQYQVAQVDSITFSYDVSHNVYINYVNSDVQVVNPLSTNGIDVVTNGQHVTVQSSTEVQDVNYILSGTTSNGSFKVYSEKRYNILFNGVTITNPTGPAINLQSTKKATLHLLHGTTNTISDGPTYAAAPVVGGIAEDQKATLFCEADMEWIGSGSLTVNAMGSEQHAVASDEEIKVKEGNWTIASAMRDGIHASEGFYLRGGSVEITSQGDGVDAEIGSFEMSCGDLEIHSTGADVKAIRSDSLMLVSGGALLINISGGASKGLDCIGDIVISGGQQSITSSGLAVLTALGSGQDVSYSSLITADGTITISGGQLNLTTTGKGGRAISGNGDVDILGGVITISSTGNGATYTNSSGTADAYHSTSIKVDGDMHWYGGELTATNAGTGGKGIDVNGQLVIGEEQVGPTGMISTTGANITISGGGGGGPGGGPGGGNSGNYDEAKTIKVDGNVTMHAGNVTVDSNDDGLKSGATITFNGGTFTVANSEEGIEAPFITVNNGQIDITSADDGFNSTAGSGGEGNDGSLLLINDGYIDINASGGDALDSNGNITINGGTVVVHGPQSSPEVGMDYNGTAKVNGGFVIISGTNSNMTQGFGTASTQRSLILKTTQSIPANTIIHLQDSDGVDVFTFKPKRSYYSIVFSSPVLQQGVSYTLFTGGSSTGTSNEGLVTGGTYTAGTNEATVNPNNIVTTVNF
ncbi:MAG: hypothetical protein RLZZ262_963 [Bacteroidota bacterium]